MPGLKSKLIVAAILVAATTVTAGCTVPLTIDCSPGVCVGG
jgi:hypothetical protein